MWEWESGSRTFEQCWPPTPPEPPFCSLMFHRQQTQCSVSSWLTLKITDETCNLFWVFCLVAFLLWINGFCRCRKALEKWRPLSETLVLLGNIDVPRLPIFSFLIRHPQSGLFLHHNFVCAILNDVFGIQARGGCACAGPYAEVSQDVQCFSCDTTRNWRDDGEIVRRDWIHSTKLPVVAGVAWDRRKLGKGNRRDAGRGQPFGQGASAQIHGIFDK